MSDQDIQKLLKLKRDVEAWLARHTKSEPKPRSEPKGGDAMWRRLPGSYGTGKRQ